jgi:hypothetical protein
MIHIQQASALLAALQQHNTRAVLNVLNMTTMHATGNIAIYAYILFSLCQLALYGYSD